VPFLKAKGPLLARRLEVIWVGEGAQQSGPQKPQPSEQEAEVVVGGGEDGVDGVA
jgi:hypothetical protein